MSVHQVFPEGFGSDPTLCFGQPLPASGRGDRPAMARPSPETAPPGFTARLQDLASYAPWVARGEQIRLSRRGFHLDASAPDESDTRPEPQGIIVTTTFVAVALAAMGYFVEAF